jgi:superfamily II DNA or RNA helicase
MKLKTGSKVKHNVYGNGIIKYLDESTAGVRFDNGLEEIPLDELVYVLSLEDCISQNHISDTAELTLKMLALTIISINDTWGVFSLSRIELLPHQLWVCKRVLENKPFRWLVADDVGLGKTIEAGLILWPLLSRKIVNRLLILCPSSLVMQWQERLRKMFDIALIPYNPSMDTNRSDFWNTYDKVVASFHTLRLDKNDRHNRMIGGKKWDLVIVDEAHHLNAIEHQGETQGFKLIDKLQKNELIDSMLFFTGTPHRGKDYGFFSLLQLLRPDLFNPRKNVSEQLKNLNKVMIRNNKENVTDLNGEKIFKKPKVRSVHYSYSTLEEEFYNMMTDFILSGKAYANTLQTTSAKNAVMLVLISLQKIASSSVAAIRKALINRLKVIQTEIYKKKEAQEKTLEEYKNISENETSDEKRKYEEDMASQLIIELMEDEEMRVKELVGYAMQIQSETRIETIIDIIFKDYPNESILFFTEYKATQSLLITELIKHFGEHNVTFINGDGEAKEVIINGESKNITLNRQIAADLFNNKKVRFLVSTEAAGEGIDLQESCYTLIHVDIPWNPMRMQQRVGRINRFGQKRQVEVITVMNPDTVESRIWTTLNDKIARIMHTHSSAMNDPEDFKWLILGMQDESFYNELQMEARKIPKEKFSDWFDLKAKTFSGDEVINTVKNLVGHSEKFNFNKVTKILPRFDLPDLKYFFDTMLEKNKRRIIKNNEYFEFLTPDNWMNRPGMKKRYSNVTYSRQGYQNTIIIGIGNRVFEEALNQAINFEGLISVVSSEILKNTIFVIKVFDKVTVQDKQVTYKIFGIEYVSENNEFLILNDNQMFDFLNSLISKKDIESSFSKINFDNNIEEIIEQGFIFFSANIERLSLSFKYPDFTLVGLFLKNE